MGINFYGYTNPPPYVIRNSATNGDEARRVDKTLEELAKEITERGNDMQVTHSKNGLKVFEVSKKFIKEIEIKHG